MNRILAVFVVVLMGLVPSLRAEPELLTNVYVVPPTFLFGDAGAPSKKSAKQILEIGGITFGPGASAVYNRSNSQLIVRNTKDQMELVEAYIEPLSHVDRLVHVSVREASFQGALPEELKSYFEFRELPAGRKEGEWAGVFDSHESLREELTRPPRAMAEVRSDRMIQVASVLTDPQLQVFIRRLEAMKGVEILSSPSVVARSGQAAMILKEQRRYGVVPVLGAVESTIDLALFLPEHGKALFGEGLPSMEPTSQAVIHDGATVVVAERNADGQNRLVFVTARLMDPAGMPIQKKAEAAPQEEAVELPSKSEPDTLGAKEQEAVRRADELALRGSQLLADGDAAGAFNAYTEALGIMPRHELTGPRRKAYEHQLNRAQKAMSKHAVASRIHIVREGETLEQIAGRFGVGGDALRAVNRLGNDPLKAGQILLVPQDSGESRTEALLKGLVLNEVDFNGATLLVALATLHEQTVRLLDPRLFPDAMPVFVVDVPEEVLEAKITLRLSNVPVAEALRYTTSLANCRYTVEGREVRILPQGVPGD